jgi:3-hydroxybutyryl-CoA dehydratase
MTPSPPQLFFEDFEPGQVYLGAPHILDDGAFRLFAQLTGDAHPIHYDEDYARATRFGGRLAHGLLLVAMTALGATPLSAQLIDSMIAFGGIEAKFVKPVLLGGSVRNAMEVHHCKRVAADKGWVTFGVVLTDDAGDQVLIGRHEYLLGTRRGGAA